MSAVSVLIRSDDPDTRALGAPRDSAPRYTMLLCTDADSIEAAQRLRHDVFTSEPGFTMADNGTDGLDADRFDQYCDHLLVRDD
ncbi:phosphohistidine phosphatase, partial [Mycobacterium sp. ITM-2017-0098]